MNRVATLLPWEAYITGEYVRRPHHALATRIEESKVLEGILQNVLERLSNDAPKFVGDSRTSTVVREVA